MVAETPTQAELQLHESKRNLASYIANVHMTDVGRPALPPKHLLERIIPILEDDSLGHTLIVAPPGSIKTNTLMAAIEWWFGQDPKQHIAYACSVDDVAQERSVGIRDTITQNPTYRQIFPDTKPDRAKGWGEKSWFLDRPDRGDKDPSLVAIGMNGTIIGRRLNRAVIDDPGDEKNMQSETERANVRRKISQAIMSRLMKGGRVVMITTRWHDEDAAGWAIGQGWHVVHIKAIENGESYWPEYWPIERLRCAGEQHPTEGLCYWNGKAWENCKMRELGAQGFGQQYQGEVIDESQSIFQRAWLSRRYTELPADARALGCITFDTAGWDEKSTTSDEAAGLVVYTDGARFYVDELVNGRMSFPEVERVALDLRASHPLPIVVEDVPWAKPLIQVLGRKLWGVIGWAVAGRSKVNRAKSITPLVEAGNVSFREGMMNLGQLIEQLARFPLAEHDDLVDVFVMALMYLSAGAIMQPKQTDAYGREIG